MVDAGLSVGEAGEEEVVDRSLETEKRFVEGLEGTCCVHGKIEYSFLLSIMLQRHLSKDAHFNTKVPGHIKSVIYLTLLALSGSITEVLPSWRLPRCAGPSLS